MSEISFHLGARLLSAGQFNDAQLDQGRAHRLGRQVIWGRASKQAMAEIFAADLAQIREANQNEDGAVQRDKRGARRKGGARHFRPVFGSFPARRPFPFPIWGPLFSPLADYNCMSLCLCLVDC